MTPVKSHEAGIGCMSGKPANWGWSRRTDLSRPWRGSGPATLHPSGAARPAGCVARVLYAPVDHVGENYVPLTNALGKVVSPDGTLAWHENAGVFPSLFQSSLRTITGHQGDAACPCCFYESDLLSQQSSQSMIEKCQQSLSAEAEDRAAEARR